MNERIKELAQLTTKDLIGMSPLLDRWQEKFAALIINECILAMWTEEHNTSDLAAEDFKKNHDLIKRHFGIA